MADTKHTGASSATACTGGTLPDERPLRVDIRPYQSNFWEYEGSRAQLEAEGVIQPGTVWPEGTDSLRWEADRFSFWLRRKRPEDLKGPMKLWVSGDWWFLRCSLVNPPDSAARRISEKRAELAALVYRQSPAGRRESEANWQRYWSARNDAAYQAFKLLVPALVPPKRGRRAAA